MRMFINVDLVIGIIQVVDSMEAFEVVAQVVYLMVLQHLIIHVFVLFMVEVNDNFVEKMDNVIVETWKV